MNEYLPLVDKYIAPAILVLVGAFLGYFFSNRLENKRQKNLYDSLYREVERINDPLKLYFPILLEQINAPKQQTINGIKPIYLDYLEAITIELMSTKYSLNNDQLNFIHNFKTLIYHFEKEYNERDKEADKGSFFQLNPKKTIEIAFKCIDMIYVLDKFSLQKENFTLAESLPFIDKYKRSCELSNIEFDENTYQKISASVSKYFTEGI
ncbi:hypothetical protein [Marinomonas sp. GJ51-6]|uniref:hypothetical protein n=1 Tax=Marinomonas sp. GJ51-6 TaxID=2992802 RepID=UPI00293477C1|nr:hypothetical protein [Marinomonas sp. GJ51-6]WOD09238.1 hypothetical protein ONZ50_09565 [Marinomonas sp. GJ51-6]